MKRLRQLFETMHLSPLTKRELEMCMPEIKRRDAAGISLMLRVVLVLLVILSAVSVIPGTGEAPNMHLYFMTLGLVFLQYIAYRVYFSKHIDKILILAYIFMITVYAFGVFQCVYLGPDSSSVAFCVLLVAVPMVVVDIPSRHAILSISMEVLLLVSYFIEGGSSGDKFVVINTICSMLLGIACSFVIQYAKLSDIRNFLLLEKQRDTDMMTGARSRVAYVRDIEMMSDEGYSAGVAFCDVNGLKRTNDTLGHEAGDRLIRDAFALMQKYFHGDSDVIYRIGGDEFVIICLKESKESFEKRVVEMAEKDERSEIISCGSIWLDRISDTELAVKDAEKVMYSAKEKYYTSHHEHDRRKE
ncbi:MAG: diguanylate cyclase [Oscillospiraceae bacterium]|nr:diguanylate cyclase [Oscillospiraceae bacterium]